MAESQARLITFVERVPRPPLVEQFRSMSWITDRLAGMRQNLIDIVTRYVKNVESHTHL
jgi:hypothetical protein